MAELNCTRTTCVKNRTLDEASLLLDRLGANLDALYTLACRDLIEDLNNGTLASALDGAMVLCDQAKGIIDGRSA